MEGGLSPCGKRTGALAVHGLSALRRVLSYNRETGIFVWRVKPCKSINAGSVAGYLGSDGYVTITYRSVRYKAHRLAWWFELGVLPKYQIDHRNGIGDDNRFTNLRECLSNFEQQQNQKLLKSNTSGFPNVVKTQWGWRVSIRHGGKRTYNKSFKEYEFKEACDHARLMKSRLHKFQPTHRGI